MLADEIDHAIDVWERRCRGYLVWDHHVELEPPYFPLLATIRNRPTEVIDDGRKPGLRDRLRGVPQTDSAPAALETAAAPQPFRASPLVELQLVLPIGFQVRSGHAAELLGALHNLSHPVSFELIGLAEGIVVQLCVAAVDKPPVVEALRAFFPEVAIREHAGLLANEHRQISGWGTFVDFGLSEMAIRQIKTGPSLETDPLIGVVGALNELDKGELAVVQVLFTPACGAWGQDFWDLASSDEDMSAVLPMIRKKFSEPVLATLIRVAAYAPSRDASFERARTIGSALIAATRSDENMLVPLDNESYPVALHEEDILRRETHRSGMLLNLSELLTLVHLPTATVRSDRLTRQAGKTRTAPVIAHHTSLILGTNEHDGDECPVGLTTEQRLRHTYLIGASGTGKSTLMLSMIAQDVKAGRGLAVLDPHGDLIDDVLARIPTERLADVILLDPADEEFPVGFNILSAHSEIERALLSSDLVGVFKRLSTSWGDQMTSIMGNAVLAFLESPEGGTLQDLRRFLVDAAFRRQFLLTVRDSEVVYFWEKEFPLLKGVPQAPLLTRLDTFLRPKLIRYMVAQKRDRLDMRAIMDEQMILLIKLSHGAIGEENSHLLGSLLVAKINQAAMSRQDKASDARIPFFVYIDEFHHFVTPSIATILSGARKYGLGLILSHQETRQLKSRSEDILSAVFGNAYTRVVFRVGEQDARALADGFSFFEAKDLQNLGIGEAIAQIERPDFDFNLKTAQLEKTQDGRAYAAPDAVRAASRANYATPKAEIEEAMQASRASPQPASGRPAKPATPPRESEAHTSKEPAADAMPDSALSTPGRGGPQHKYLQGLVKKLAEDRGFSVSLEVTVLEGHGYVDVVLDRDGIRTACEISVSTRLRHEVGNLTKCLAAGFDHVVLISSDERMLARARTEMAGVDQSRVRFLQAASLASFFDEVGKSPRSDVPSPNKAPQRKAATSGLPPGGASKHVLIARDAAEYLGMATQTLAKMRVSGESPPYYKVGRLVMYDRDDLDAWLSTRRRRSTSDKGPAGTTKRDESPSV